MRLLLDTHVVLWWLGDSPEIADETRAWIADTSNEVAVSAATAWEMAIKQQLGKLRVPTDFSAAIEKSNLSPLAVSIEHALKAGSLPTHHRDPFDRMLIAQALLEGYTIVTRDERFQVYGVPVLDA